MARQPTTLTDPGCGAPTVAVFSDPADITIGAGGGFGGNTAIEVDVKAGPERDLTSAATPW